MDSTTNLRSNVSRSVIVIGAGIGGITAARNLMSSGFQVIVLESSGRIGGRIHTDRETFGVPIDMGASWIHGCDPKHNPVAELAEKLRLEMHETSEEGSPLYDHEVKKGFELFCEGQRIDQGKVREFERWYQEALADMRKEHRDWFSVETVIERIVSKYGIAGTLEEKLLNFFVCRIEGWFAADASLIPSKNWIFEEFLPGGHSIFVNGYSQIVETLAKDVDVKLHHRVTKVVHPGSPSEPRRVRVTCENGSSFEADAAVVAVPLGVLQSNSIEFSPELPDWKRAAINGLIVGHQNKIALMFDSLFWADDAEFLGSAGSTPGECSYFLSLYSAVRRPVIVYMPVGELAKSLESMSDEDAIEFAMARVREMFPDAPNPVKASVSKWSSDTNILGCYSYDPNPEGYSQRYKLMSHPVSDCLLFAGEASSSDYSSTVHGAYETGALAAKTLTERFQREEEEVNSGEVDIEESLLSWVERRTDILVVSCNLARQVLSAVTLSK